MVFYRIFLYLITLAGTEIAYIVLNQFLLIRLLCLLHLLLTLCLAMILFCYCFCSLASMIIDVFTSILAYLALQFSQVIFFTTFMSSIITITWVVPPVRCHHVPCSLIYPSRTKTFHSMRRIFFFFRSGQNLLYLLFFC